MASEAASNDVMIPDRWRTKPAVLFAIGVTALLLSVGWSYLMAGANNRPAGVKFFLHSYLTNYMYVLGFGLGALFFVLIQFLCRAGWSTSIRRMGEIIASTIPWMAVLFIPILVMVLATKSTSLYEWNTAHPEGLIAAKSGYLNGPFFAIRAVVYFLVFIGAAHFVYSNSRQQDETGDASLTLKVQGMSGPLVMLYSLALNFAAFDWVMSIDADWYSTIFGVIIFAGGLLSYLCLTVLLSLALQKEGKLKKQITVDNFHDLGKFIFGMNMFWTYVSFSQFLLYWYGDIPEETTWYKVRMDGGWQWVGFVLIVGHFVIPFLGLMSRHVRRHRFGLAFWSVWLLLAQWVDLTFLIMPNTGAFDATMMVGHLFGFIGMVSIFLGMLVIRGTGVPLLAVRDPRLPEAVAYHNFP